MGGIKTYLQASRLHLFSMAFGGIVLGTAYGKRLSGTFDWIGFLLAAAIGLFCHVAVSFSNELADDEADAINRNRTMFNGGTGLLQSGAISRTELSVGWKISALLAIAFSLAAFFLASAHYLIIAVTAIGLILGIGYSLRPLVLSRRGLGEISAFLAYGIPTMLCGAVMQIPRESVGTALTDGFFYLLALPGALATFTVLSLTMIPDTDSDRSSGRKSISVILGEKTVIVLSGILLLAVAALFALFFGLGRYGTVFAAVSVTVPLLAALYVLTNLSAWKDPTGKAMMRIITAAINTAMAAFFLPALSLLLGP